MGEVRQEFDVDTSGAEGVELRPSACKEVNTSCNVLFDNDLIFTDIVFAIVNVLYFLFCKIFNIVSELITKSSGPLKKKVSFDENKYRVV